MQKLHFFIDTHDSVNGTFSRGITPAQLAEFYASYEAACAEEGVVSVNIQVGFEEGRAFCLTMAPSVEAVRRERMKKRDCRMILSRK